MADIAGLHHVTAICGAPGRNRAFHTQALGLRMIKRTVNFDDPTSWHLYYGDAVGAPGSALTFFAWPDAPAGAVGAGQTSLTHFAVPRGALDFWEARLAGRGGRFLGREAVFGEDRARFLDPDGMAFALVETDDPRTPWTTPEIGEAVALRGFHGVTLALREAEATRRILADVFGYALQDARQLEGGAQLIRLRAPGPAGVVDLHVDPAAPRGREGVGSVHHIAFSTPDRAAQQRVRARMRDAGLRVTEPIDRQYFTAIYSRTPGGVLFEVATDGPGFEVDEPRAALGAALQLPPQHEPMRARIEAALPPLD